MLNETLAQARAWADSQVAALEAERRDLERDVQKWNGEVRKLASDLGTSDLSRLADLQERIRSAERRATEIREQVIALRRELVDEREVARALSAFDPAWESLAPRE
ncbi:MAG: hypothetical protein RMI91_11845 [Gemmatales bacterium]|nr:hypothetical protein [Gemmatales bacterium]MDW7995332.1 hypothetical protein [Gemmatales bacterium]